MLRSFEDFWLARRVVEWVKKRQSRVKWKKFWWNHVIYKISSRSRSIAWKVESLHLDWDKLMRGLEMVVKCHRAPHDLGPHPNGWAIAIGKLDGFPVPMEQKVWRQDLSQNQSLTDKIARVRNFLIRFWKLTWGIVYPKHTGQEETVRVQDTPSLNMAPRYVEYY